MAEVTGEHEDPLADMDEMSGDDGPAPPVSRGTLIKVGLSFIRAILRAIGKKKEDGDGSRRDAGNGDDGEAGA